MSHGPANACTSIFLLERSATNMRTVISKHTQEKQKYDEIYSKYYKKMNYINCFYFNVSSW